VPNVDETKQLINEAISQYLNVRQNQRAGQLSLPLVSNNKNQKQMKLKHKAMGKKSGYGSRAMRSVRQTETDYDGTGGEMII